MGWSAAPGAGEPYEFPAKLLCTHSEDASAGLRLRLSGPGGDGAASSLGNFACRREASDLKLARAGPSLPVGARAAGVCLLSLPSVSPIFPQRWRKTWAVLYPASPHGVARLEFFDHKGSSSGGGRGSTRRLDCKVIRLAECVSVAPVAVESPPEPGATAFRLDTAQRSHLLAADAPSSAAWVQTLCRNAFPVRGPGLPVRGWGELHWAQESMRGGSSYSGRGTGLTQTLGTAARELQSPSYSFSLPQKGSWALAPAENPPKLSALEMLENSLYSPAWEGRCLKSPSRDGMERKGVLQGEVECS